MEKDSAQFININKILNYKYILFYLEIHGTLGKGFI